MPARTITIAGLGDFRQLQTELERTGVIADKSATTMATSSKRAGAAAAEQAKMVGASVDEQVAAAGRAAAAFSEAQAKMTYAQRAASHAAAEAGKAAGLSADQQVAAAKRAADAQKKAADEQIAASRKAAEASKAASGTHATVSKVGGVVALGVAGAAVEAVKLGEGFQTAQAAIQGATQQSTQEVGKLTDAFKTLGTGSSAAVGSGMQMEAAYAAVAGQLKLTEGHALSAAEATKFSAAANNLAESGAATLTEAYSATAKILQTFHLSADHAAEVTDTLYSTSKAVHVPVEQLASSMGKLHAALGSVAPSMQDVSGFIVALGGKGLTGGRGVQVVGSAMQTLLGDSKPVTDTLKALGVTLTDSSGRFIGMHAAIERLQPALAALPENQRRNAEATLLGKGATEKLGQVILAGANAFDRSRAAANQHTAAQKAAELQSKTFHNEMEALKHTVETLGGSLGVALIPKIQAMAKALNEGIQWLDKHKAAAKALGVVIAGVLGAAVSVFAYDQSKKFIDGTKRMVDGLKALGTKVLETTGIIQTEGATQAATVEANAAKMEASNATAGASFTVVGGEATAGEATTAGAVAGEAAAVTTADDTIAADNVAAGASFTALLGPIGIAVAAVVAAEPLLNKFTGGGLTEGAQHPSEINQAYEATKAKYGTGAPAGQGQLGQSNQYPFVSQIAEKYGISPHTLWGIYGTETSYGSNISTSTTGAQGAFQFEPGTAKAYGYPETNKPNPKQFQEQAEAAARYIQANKHKYGSEAAAVEAYYAGHPGTAEGAGYRHTVEQKGGAHYGKAQEAEIKHLQSQATHPNAALQQMEEEKSGARPKKGAKPKKAPTEPYVEPLEGAHQTSVDMGVDYTAKVHSAVKAIGAGVIEKIIGSWYEGQPLIEEKLTQGARKGQDVYYAEGLTSSVREGQRVRAGQMIGRTTTQPTGLELGFGAPGGLTAAQAAGEHKGELGARGTQAGQQFEKFIGSIGKGGTAFSLMTKGAETAAKAAEKLAKAAEAAMKALESHGTTLYKKYETELQSGGIKPLEKLLGTHTETLGQVKIGQGPWKPSLYNTDAGSVQNKELNTLVAALRATHKKSLEELASKLVTVHKEAEQTLGQELADAQADANARTLVLQTTQLKDQTQLVANMVSAQVTAMKDAATAITDAFSAAATAIKDATREMADASQATVSSISDRSQTETDILGERGLYGLNLVAQQQKVALDEMKGGYDAGIASAQMAVDKAQTATDKATAATTAIVDAVTAQQNGLISQAQTNLDNVTKSVDTQVAEAQNAVAVAATGTTAQQAHAAAGLRTAEAAAGSAIQRAQTNLTEAQSFAERAEQEAATAVARAQGNAGVVIAQAEQVLTEATDKANVAEAEQQALIAKTQAEAATQYAGSGLTINIEGLNPTDGAVVASEVGWALRTKLPA